MPIVRPGLFRAARPPSFEWDDWNYLDYFYFLPEELHDRLLGLTHNANFALAIGSATWILARFEDLDADREARDFVAACWAEMTEEWHCARFFPPDDAWRGPVRGPMVTAMTILYDAIDGRGDSPEMADRSTWMHNFAEHVIDPLDPYGRWFDWAVARLEGLHSWPVEGRPEADLFADHFPQGRPVAPEALMPDADYDPAAAPRLLDAHVWRERRNGNPFVLDDDEFEASEE